MKQTFSLTSRIEYDAYRVDLEELNLGPRDATTVPKLESAQKEFQAQRERYEKMRDALSVKLKLLEENKVRTLRVTANRLLTTRVSLVYTRAIQVSQRVLAPPPGQSPLQPAVAAAQRRGC